MNLNNIIFEYLDADKKFAYGIYANFKLIIHVETGYLNASKLCSEYSNKKLREWLRNNRFKKLIISVNKIINQSVNLEVGIHTSEIIEKLSIFQLKNIALQLRGSYVHPLIIPHVAMWISDEFAIKVSLIINNYELEKSKKLIKTKDDIIKYLNIEKENLVNDHNILINKLNIALENQSPKLNNKLDPVYILWKINDTQIYVSRTQKKSINNIKNKHPLAIPLLILNHPNPTILHHQMKIDLKDKYIFNNNYINSVNNEILDKAKELDNQRKKI